MRSNEWANSFYFGSSYPCSTGLFDGTYIANRKRRADVYALSYILSVARSRERSLSLLELIVFGIYVGVLENRLVLPEIVGCFELNRFLRVLSPVVGFGHPVVEDLAMTLELFFKLGITSEIIDLMWIFCEVVEFLFGPDSKPVFFLVRGEAALIAKTL